MIQKYNKTNNNQKYFKKNQGSNKQYNNKPYHTTEENTNNKQPQQKTQQEPQSKEDVIISLLQDILQELKYIKGKLTVFKNNKPISLAESMNNLLQYLVPQEENETISEEEMEAITR
jgi:hypothetical protein